ncbi:MAG: metallophosphoesterase family protein [Candidatus Omnitrophica bacterium]|nr:metallophosphoesterase family protein [Candidatus Omnitrophota bacterium]
MRILVLSDTHIPRAAHSLPETILDEIKKSDMVLHAGDFVDEEVLDNILKLNKDLHAVYGNMDSQALRRRLKDKEIITAGKFKIGLIHGYGAPKDLIQTVAGEFRNVDAIVFGHSHSAINIEKDGMLFFNPGSPTDTIFAKANTYGILEVDEKGIKGTIVRLQ